MIKLENDLILAPMAGYSDIGFRCLCEKYGASLTVSEMVSVKALFYGSEKTDNMLFCDGLKKPKSVQLFGNDPQIFESVIKSGKLNEFDMIDINMGCPAPKIIKNKEGSFLLKDIVSASKIVSCAVKSSNKPVSVKFRSGFDDQQICAKEFAKMCEDCGASLITIHARTTEQKYSGKADLEIIKQVKDSVKIPVCGNGDVFDKESYEKMKQTGVDFVMIGRGSIGNPYVFAEILGEECSKNLFDDIKFHYEKMREVYSEHVVINNMKKHLAFYLKKQNGYKDFLKEIFSVTTINKALKLLKDFLNA
ncbi:MAG: tRNA dihydrouridine synthase [Christensenellales bacterium]